MFFCLSLTYGSFRGLSLTFDTMAQKGNNLCLSFSNSFLRLPHNGFKRVRYLESRPCVRVFLSVSSLSRVWVGHCWRLQVGEEGSNAGFRVCSVLDRRGKSLLVFSFYSGTRSSSPRLRISINRSPTPSKLSLSVSWVLGLGVFPKPLVTSRFITNNPSFTRPI